MSDEYEVTIRKKDDSGGETGLCCLFTFIILAAPFVFAAALAILPFFLSAIGWSALAFVAVSEPLIGIPSFLIIGTCSIVSVLKTRTKVSLRQGEKFCWIYYWIELAIKSAFPVVIVVAAICGLMFYLIENNIYTLSEAFYSEDELYSYISMGVSCPLLPAGLVTLSIRKKGQLGKSTRTKAPQVSPTVFCHACGFENESGVIFCQMCGSSLSDNEQVYNESQKYEDEVMPTKTVHKKHNAKGLRFLVCIVVVALLLTFVSSWAINFANDPQRAIAKESRALLQQADQLIGTGDFHAALSALNQISTKWEDYDKIYATRQKAERGVWMTEINRYQSSGNYEELVAYIDKNIPNPATDAEIQGIYEEAARRCKETALTKIAAYLESEDYLGAIQYTTLLGMSTKNDPEIVAQYNRAVAYYETAVINEAEAYAQTGDYFAARSVLSVAEDYIGQTRILTEKIAEINERGLTAQVFSLIEAENYGDAIVLLNSNSTIVSGSPDLQSKLKIYIEKYRGYIITEAAAAYENGGYSAAVSVLNSALQVLPNDTTLCLEKARYEGLAPVALVNMKAFYSDYGKDTKLTGVTLKDKLGNTYTDCIEYFGGHSLFAGGNVGIFDRRDTYILGGQYVTFKATVFVPAARTSYWDTEISPTNLSRGSFTLRIYGDGKLLYQSPLMISTQYPVAIEIDVSGIDQLSFAWATFDDVSSEIGIAEAFFYKD